MNIMTLKVTIKDVTCPKITRTIQLPATCNLLQLHRTLQDAVGWDDAHLYEFRDSHGRKIKALKNKLVVDLIGDFKSKLYYEYDMGDSWEHEIVMKSLLAETENKTYPIIIDWSGACPPEDCGGSFGFAEIKAALQEKKLTGKALDEEYELLEDYDPVTSFDPTTIVIFRDLWIDGKYKKNCPRYVRL